MLTPADRVLVAVSGGPDSVALLHLLHELREELGLRLEVAHLQHGMRGEEARGDAEFVRELAAKLELPFHLKDVNVPELKTTAGKGNLESLARAERYRFFAEVARAHNLGKVATAHTQDDQAETVLMWMLRGAGRKGLGGMAPIQRRFLAPGGPAGELMIIRPLLEVSKEELLAYLKERQLDYRLDRTNEDPKLLRNWIRLHLLPELEEKFGARLRTRLAGEAVLLREEDAMLDGLARSELERIRTVEGLSLAPLLKMPAALQRRVIRLWIEETKGSLSGMDYGHLDAILELMEGELPQGRLSIPGGWELAKEYGIIRLQKNLREKKPICYSYELRAGTPLVIPEAGMTITSDMIFIANAKLPGDQWEAVFDSDALPGPLIVRNFRAGDRFQPLGTAGHKKVKDLFIERKVPLPARAIWPLLVMGEDVLWIPAYGRSALAKISARTRAVLRLKAAAPALP